jgi:hypothetical protein
MKVTSTSKVERRDWRDEARARLTGSPSRVNYSAPLDGDEGNYFWPVTVDIMHARGYVGLTQTQDGTTARVLISPTQWRSIVRFVRGSDR